jgi:hypothetical protein
LKVTVLAVLERPDDMFAEMGKHIGFTEWLLTGRVAVREILA